MQQAAGLDVRWLDAGQACEQNPTLATTGHRGGSYVADDGCIDPPRNVRAYSLAMQAAGVDLRERTAFTGLETRPAGEGRSGSPACETSADTIATERVVLTGGPSLRAVARSPGVRIPVGAARHTVRVTRAARGVRRRPAADGVRHRRGPVLAARGRRPAVRLERPGRSAG